MFTLFTDLSKPINTDDSANNPVTHHYVFFSFSHCAIYIFETMRSFLCNELLCLLMPERRHVHHSKTAGGTETKTMISHLIKTHIIWGLPFRNVQS